MSDRAEGSTVTLQSVGDGAKHLLGGIWDKTKEVGQKVADSDVGHKAVSTVKHLDTKKIGEAAVGGAVFGGVGAVPAAAAEVARQAVKQNTGHDIPLPGQHLKETLVRKGIEQASNMAHDHAKSAGKSSELAQRTIPNPFALPHVTIDGADNHTKK